MVLDGKIASESVKAIVKKEVGELIQAGNRAPHLAAILVGNDGASETYVASKAKNCEEVGFSSTLIRFDTSITEQDLLKKIIELNNNAAVDGILVQLPLP